MTNSFSTSNIGHGLKTKKRFEKNQNLVKSHKTLQRAKTMEETEDDKEGMNVKLVNFLKVQNQAIFQTDYFNTITKKLKTTHQNKLQEQSKQSGKEMRFLDLFLPMEYRKKQKDSGLSKKNKNMLNKTYAENASLIHSADFYEQNSLRNSISKETYKYQGKESIIQIQKTEKNKKTVQIYL